MNAVAECNLPLSIMDSEEFRDLLTELDPQYQPPCATDLAELVDEQYGELETTLKGALATVTDISFTADCATIGPVMQSDVVTLEGHWICGNWRAHSAVLGVQLAAAEGRTVTFLSEALTGLRERWRGQPTLFAGISEGAASVLRCLADMKEDRIVKESYRCAHHCCHLIVGV